MALQQWAVPQLATLLSLDEDSSRQAVSYAEGLPDADLDVHFQDLLGESPESLQFITSFKTIRAIPGTTVPQSKVDSSSTLNGTTSKDSEDTRQPDPPSQTDKKATDGEGKSADDVTHPPPDYHIAGSSRNTPQYAPPPVPPPSAQMSAVLRRPMHTNQVIEAEKVRARDEQEMQNLLQTVQMQYGIYNADIEPEHDTDYYCGCPIHNYQRRKWARYGVQRMWSRAVMYPGEKAYDDDYRMSTFFSGNPYRYAVVSPYGNFNSGWYQQRPSATYHALNVRQTIALNAKLNAEAQRNVDSREPKASIWEIDRVGKTTSEGDGREKRERKEKGSDEKKPAEKGDILQVEGSSSKGVNAESTAKQPPSVPATVKKSKLGGLMQAMKIGKSDEKKAEKAEKQTATLREAILQEESGRWPDHTWRHIVTVYQEKIGMARKVADLRARQPLQYLHLLRAGYFEPIPVAWANLASNPLKFSIEASSGWRGITPTWRGYEDTAEERLYWVLNHREGSVGMRMKPDYISEMEMARARMAMAVEPPPEYFSPSDTCHLQHTSEGYSKQVMPPPFRAFDRPETPNDDTMILLDVSGSMDFDPVRPVYDQYLITGYVRGTQPKNKDVAKAIIRRFTDAMANHDHTFNGYDLTTFSSQATYIGSITHNNLDAMWRKVRIGGGTRVMTGWQKVKDLHFQKHSASATHHPVYGWQAGPDTPILRLLLLLDGEATDMDEFELDLLGLSWAHVTIFLIGVDGCPHHHRHANELQRISDVNHHVSFVDAQGNTPERFVTHELLKRHLGYDVTMSEFERMEELPTYTA